VRLEGQISIVRRPSSTLRDCLGRLALSLGLAALAACTPVAAVKRGEMSDKEGVSTETANGGVAGSDAEQPRRTMTATVADACAEPGKRVCSTSDPRVPLRCEGSRWQAELACGQTERCETEQGARLGTCVPIASECLLRGPEEEFCDRGLIRSCDEYLVLSKGRECEERRRCMEVGGRAQCVCAEGWVDDGSGAGCQMPTSCANENGGCDLLTKCSLSGGARVCSECPPGYEGDGETGCFAQLTSLSVEPSALTPAFSPAVHSYRVRLPLLQQSVLVTAGVADEVGVHFQDGEPPTSAGGWQSPPLPLGEHKIEISLTTPFGRESKYELVVERAGIQEAYVKAADPDRDDELGSSVAIWGDTMAVGVFKDDSSGARGDSIDNAVEDSGAVRIFTRTGDRWSEEAYLKADPPRAGDYFGSSVALRDDMLVVGAPGASAIAASTPHGGSVHVYTRASGRWTLLKKLDAAGSGAQDLFGHSVALDERRLVVGAPFESSGETLSGAIYVFERSGDSFGAPRRIKASPVLGSGLFGWSIAVGAESTVVGSPQYNSLSPSSTGTGLVHVFNSADWTQLHELTPPASLESGATFGWTVDIAGNTIAVGAPRARTGNVGQAPGDAFVYERASGGAWSMSRAFRAPAPRASDWFGYVVKLSSPTTLLVSSVGDASGAAGLAGDPHNDALVDSGAVLMYGRHGNEWLQTTFIKASNPDKPDYFGCALALHADTLVITSPGEASDAAGINSNQGSNAAPFAGAAYVFR